MKHLMAIVILLVLTLGCAPSGNAATGQPQATVPDGGTGAAVQTAGDCSVEKARISSLESQLAACQSANSRLQKQVDQAAAAGGTATAKEPVSGDAGSYTMKFDKPGLQYPNKYLVWDITGLDCGSFDSCTLKSALSNNHPTLAMTKVTVNDDSLGAASIEARIGPGETLVNTKNLVMPKVLNYQITLRWVWQ